MMTMMMTDEQRNRGSETRHGSSESDLLDRLATPTDLAGLHRLLEVRAEQEGLLDVAYHTMDSPVGPLLLAATSAGLVRVAYEREGFDTVLQTLATRLGPRVLRAPQRLEGAAGQLEEYFAGARTRFDLTLDRTLSTGFRGQVHAYLPQIAYGSTQSYRDVAAHMGNPRAVRAVGSACATNPLPIVVPCHRVLRSDGGLGGYLGGTQAKTTLLGLEHAAGPDGWTVRARSRRPSVGGGCKDRSHDEHRDAPGGG